MTPILHDKDLQNLLRIRPSQRTALFIDGANLYAAIRTIGFSMDFDKLLQVFEDNSDLVRAYYYASMLNDSRMTEQDPMRGLISYLSHNGYTTIVKTSKTYVDDTGRPRLKGNVDVDLTVGLLQAARFIEHAILFSGDGDFKPAVEAVQNQGVRVTVISTSRTSPPMIADELWRQCDRFVDLEVLIPNITRQRISDYDNSSSNNNGENNGRDTSYN